MNAALAWLPALLALALALPLPLPLPVAIAGAAAAFLVLPGRWLARRLQPGAPRAERALTALAATPFLVGAPAALVLAAGGTSLLAGRVLALAAFALGAWDAARAPRRAAAEPGAAPPAIEAAWLPAIAWAALVAIFFAANPHLAPRSDGWFHGAVTLQLAARGLPPTDPDFGGLPLLYFWGYHLWASLWVALIPRMAVWTPLVAFQLSASVAVMLGVGAVAARLGAGRRGVRVAGALAAVGYAPFAWLLVPARALVGDVSGWAEVERLMTHGASAGLRAMASGMLHCSLAWFGDKYFLPTPLSMGLALYAAILAAQLDVLERPGVRRALRLALFVAAALFTHTVVGISSLLVAGAWGAWLAARALRGEARARAAFIPSALAYAAALAALSPYLFSVAHSKTGQLAPGFTPLSITSAIFPGGLYLAFGASWLWRRRRDTPGARELLAPSAVLLALGLVLRLSEANQTKFLNLLFLALAAPAALGLLQAEGWRGGTWRRALRWLVAFATVPTLLFALWAFATERGQEDDPTHFGGREVREAWGWVRGHTPPDALVADRLGASDMQVFAARDAMWAGRMLERNWGHPDSVLDLRRRSARALGDGREPDAEAARFLAGLGREVLVDLRTPAGLDSTGALARAAADPRFEPLVRNREIAIYRWSAAR